MGEEQQKASWQRPVAMCKRLQMQISADNVVFKASNTVTDRSRVVVVMLLGWGPFTLPGLCSTEFEWGGLEPRCLRGPPWTYCRLQTRIEELFFSNLFLFSVSCALYLACRVRRQKSEKYEAKIPNLNNRGSFLSPMMTCDLDRYAGLGFYERKREENQIHKIVRVELYRTAGQQQVKILNIISCKFRTKTERVFLTKHTPGKQSYTQKGHNATGPQIVRKIRVLVQPCT